MTSDFAEKNRQVFEKKSRTYKSDFAKGVESLVNVTQTQRTWVSDVWTDTEAGRGKELKMLEYACGPGHISLALAPFVSSVVGMDISDGMIHEFNKNVHEAGRSDTMTGVKANLLADTTPEEVAGPQYFDFDIVVVSMALHHFEHPEKALKSLGTRLKQGGVMMIIDLIPEHHPDHGLHRIDEVVQTISKHGFSTEEMQKMYEDAGLGGEFKYRVIEEPLEFRKDGNTFFKTIFVARGRK
ncbi:S-adenosyl-L-methionine-dependent methyltransferase [Aspergillus heterothallicus]